MLTASFYNSVKIIISISVYLCACNAYKYDETSALKIDTSTTQQGHNNHNKADEKEPPSHQLHVLSWETTRFTSLTRQRQIEGQMFHLNWLW